MTQSVLRKSSQMENAEKLKKSNNSDTPRYVSEKCITITAWILLTLGLCIITATFYVTFAQRNNDTDYEDIIIDNHMENDSDIMMEFRKSSIITDNIIVGTSSWRGCEDKACKIVCTNTKNLYDTLYDTLNYTNCSTIDSVHIRSQRFPSNALKNSWKPQNQSVHELFLVNSNVKKIRNAAFNSPIFSSLFHLLWRNLNLNKVESGALLGLHSLKYLTIETPMPQLDRAFFQPVQTTLKRLKLNAFLNVSAEDNIFGISCLENLEYVDLSYNNFTNTISSEMFLAIPNVKHLHMTNAKITSIASDAFQNLIGTLNVLNLSHNQLTSISSTLIESLLIANSRSILNFAANNWVCDCELYPFALLTRNYSGRFMDMYYCKAPQNLYGTFLNELQLEDCDATTTKSLTIETISDNSYSTTPTTTKSHNEGYINLPTIDDDINLSTEEDINVNNSKMFRMLCLQNDVATHSVQSRSLEFSTSYNHKLLMSSTMDGGKSVVLNLNDPESTSTSELPPDEGFLLPAGATDLEYFEFESPEYELELELLQNNSAKVIIKNYVINMKPPNVIWFSKQLDSASEKFKEINQAAANIDYQCNIYSQPYIIAEDLVPNSTYTFCVLPLNQYTITPFNCLPLHVPKHAKQDIWISKDEQPFTIGMLCVIFVLSLFFGAVVAYFGIKTYPELLEGSKNVLVVKKSDQNCYVSTISETDYLKSSSMKKQHLKKNSIKPALPETPTYMAPPPPCSISDKNLERLSSLKSSSTFFDEPFGPISFPSDQYELPKEYKRTMDYEERSVPNPYATSPCSPPPLPKRNSTATENLVVNRFSKTN